MTPTGRENKQANKSNKHPQSTTMQNFHKAREVPYKNSNNNTIFFFKSQPQKARVLNEKIDSRQLEVVQYERHCAKRHEQAQRSFSKFQK
jgi:hypothetical protein